MEVFNSLAPVIQEHIKQMAKTTGLPLEDETYEKLAKAWVEKEKAFQEALQEHRFEEVSFFGKDDPRGLLVLTYSGSLLSIGPLKDGKRRVEYTSIGLRTDVPDSAVKEDSDLAEDVETDAVVKFSRGPIQQSSPVYKIAVFSEEKPAEEEDELLTQVIQELSEDFAEINKTVID
ncbi:hypothetical protein [Spirochaeta thermophila]|uniref:Uncharacterized protein n=1 Tax=Winmispira thermophila (strain ATCC 49972 / DSM 6192 / RI 19.B1) TaxID=665571 RepID=E0RRF2_WINT6|nr:hypothetical protein [Spirochaeta thermophila]ADN01653.1 hypothetical protein STHERM_c06950 [Spirochaeta thermophila DSM 6192]